MFSFNCRGRLLNFNEPIVMGIVNLTPDSFNGGLLSKSKTQIFAEIEKHILDGATILDIGGQSTRPGSNRITSDEEFNRIKPYLKEIRKLYPNIFISIDTYYAEVAKKSADLGADMINDISAGNIDADMLNTIAQLKLPYIAMHMQGTPNTMQNNPTYKNVTVEVFDFFVKKIEELLQYEIIDVAIDVGFGFGKTIEHNFELLKNLNSFQFLQKPILAGISRKSFIYKTLNTNPENALNGTTALHMIALQKGANILRVHDVKHAVECIKLYKCLV